MPDDKAWLTVSSGALTAQINPLGSQLSTLRGPSGHDLLWDGNPAFWGTAERRCSFRSWAL